MMNAVGIDVSKNKSTVTIRRPGDEVVLTPGLRIVTVLLFLETSIPTAFIIKTSLDKIAMVNTGFTHCLFNLLVFYTNAWFNLHKTNVANEKPVG